MLRSIRLMKAPARFSGHFFVRWNPLLPTLAGIVIAMLPAFGAEKRDFSPMPAEQKFSRSNLNRPSAKPSDVIHGSLESTVIRAEDVR